MLQVTGDHSALTYFFSYIFPISLTIVLVSFVTYYQAKWWDHYTWLYSGKGNAYTWPITIGKDGEWQGGDRTSVDAVPSPGGHLIVQWNWLESSPSREHRSWVSRNVLVFFYISPLALRT